MKNRVYTESKRIRYLREGRGQGEGKEYKPWITVQNFSSIGRSSRPYSKTSGRKHQLFSKLEADYLYLFDWFDNIIDIREQYPLQRDLTIDIATQKSITHPRDNQSRVFIDLTTDFLLTLIDSDQKHYFEAYTVKNALDLEKDRVIEKFEIERQYWKMKNVNWRILTEKELPLQLIKNIFWCREYSSFDSLELSAEFIHLFVRKINEIKSELLIHQACILLDSQINLIPGKSLQIFRFLIANKKILISKKCDWYSGVYVSDIIISESIKMQEILKYAS